MLNGSQIKIVFAEDQQLIREGVAALLVDENAISIVGEADNGLDAVRICGELKPDVALMDLSMPKMSGIDATREIRRHYPNIRVLVLSVDQNERQIAEAFRAGATGYAVKSSTRDELKKAILSVAKGQRYLAGTVSSDMVDYYLKNGNGAKGGGDVLTPRERQILKLIAEGHRNRNIAEQLFISVKTVENHRANLMRKLNLHNAAELTTYAIKQKMIADV